MWLVAKFIGRAPNDQRKLDILGITTQDISGKVSKDRNMAAEQGIGGGPNRTSIDQQAHERSTTHGGASLVTGWLQDQESTHYLLSKEQLSRQNSRLV